MKYFDLQINIGEVGSNMSVVLLVTYHNPDKENRLVPIATEGIFQDYWQPTSAALGLQWVPLFQGGIPITAEDIPFIIDELGILRNYVSGKIHLLIPQDMANLMVKRIDTLIPELKHLQDGDDAEIFIG